MQKEKCKKKNDTCFHDEVLLFIYEYFQ